jgi:anti-sigma factor RsiW
MDIHNRDRFELLSAYLDGEVSAAERRQIESWLTTDPQVQCLYARVLKLRSRWGTMPLLPAQQPVSRRVKQVSACLNNRPKMGVIWGTTALAAVLLGVLSDGLPDHQSKVSEFNSASKVLRMRGVECPTRTRPCGS